jgi:hypothetical protein
MEKFSESLGVSKAASNGRLFRIDVTQYSLLGLDALAVGFGSERRICCRSVIMWIGRLFPISEIKSKAFSSYSRKSIVISRTVEVPGSS